MGSIGLKMIAGSESQTSKDGYWNSELRSLGIHPRRKNEANDNEELEKLTDNVKQSMYQDYEMAYSKDGEKYKDEAESMVSN